MTTTAPSRLARLRAGAVAAPGRLLLAVSPSLRSGEEEDVFTAGAGGDWVWYPSAGTLRPLPLGTRWRLGGRGAGALGSVTRAGDRLRFVPTSYWRRREVAEWERRVVAERTEGSWLLVDCEDGSAVLRRRGRPARGL